MAASLPVEEDKMICDKGCESKLDSLESQSLPSGLKYKDITLGTGPAPPVGYQVS